MARKKRHEAMIKYAMQERGITSVKLFTGFKSHIEAKNYDDAVKACEELAATQYKDIIVAQFYSGTNKIFWAIFDLTRPEKTVIDIPSSTEFKWLKSYI